MTVVAKPLALVLCLVWCIVAAPVRSQEVYLPPFLSAPSSVSGGTGAQQCSSSAGPVIPCGAESMASSGGTVVPVGVANPINVMSGNKYQREDDLPALPGVFGLEIVRHYNSFHSGPGSPNGILGRGWRLSYETSLHVSGRTLQIAQADGSRIIFSRDPFNPSLCATADPADGTVEIRKTARGDEYVWTWSNGRRLDFNSDGKLVQILAPTGEFVTLQYNRRGWLQKVTDPQGRSLHLRYAEKTTAPAQRFTGVVAIDSPVGQYKYEHGSVLPHAAVLDKVHVIANLVKVSYPSGQEAATARTYHYEDPRHPTLLTGISMTGTGNDGQSISRRVSTYAYHANGLAILSVKGAPAQYEKDKDGNIVQPARLVEGTGIEQVTLDFSEPGQTTITNSLGRTTVYRYAMIGGGLRLLEVAGAGCSSCGEPNVRYRYDRLGRLIETIKLDAEGKPVGGMQRELDHFGRIVQVTGTGYRNGKPGKARWLVRYQYQGNQLQPALLARPSVVAGRQHQTRITYNDVGQPTRIMESGWAPAIDGAGAPTPIERVTTLAYASINGRSLLVRVDGPLPNGPADSPADSDITHIDWDGKGNAVTAITAPGGFKSMAAYDQAGRIIEAVNADGRKSIFTYSARNRLTAVTTDGITQRVGYDAFGNTVEAGHVVAGVYKALARSGFDEAGRNMWSASHLGILRRHRFDSEGKLLELTTQSAGISQTQRLAYDGADRLIAVTDMHGATRRIRWGRDGLPEAMVDALGRETRYRYDATGGVERVTEAANTLHAHLHNTTTRIEYDPFGRTEAVIAPNGAVTRYVRDDFGRMLAVSSADSGTLRKEYDAADRLVVGTDANGNQVRYQYDAAGRFVKQTVIEAQAADTPRKTIATSWRYEGSRLAAIEHPDQAEHYRYDDKGRLVTRMVTFRLAGDFRGTSFTHYRYDEMGQLASASLPDGSVLHYRRNGQNQVTAIERSVLRTPWLRWLRPTQTIVRDLRRDTVGLKNFTYGNGIEAHFQRSREGALARIMYRHPDGRTENEQRSAALDMLFGISTAHAASPDAPANAARPRALDLPTETRALLDHRYLWDAEGNLLHAHNKDSVDDYAYDPQDRLIVAATTPAGQLNAAATGLARYARYFYDGAGNRVLSQEAVTDQADITAGTESSAYGASNSRLLGTSASAPPTQTRYDAGGQPHRFGERKYRWDAFGKLLEVRQANRVLANYRYNHRGERIAKMVNNVRTHFLYEDRKIVAELDDAGRISRQYVYLADRPIAVIDTADGDTPAEDTPSTLSQIAADMRVIVKAWFSAGDRIAYLHNNHLGATELITDRNGEPLWNASYSPYGKIMAGTRASAFTFRLRLPGQYEDEETGLYYNDYRYYDPGQGRYLTPDPLGLRGGINSYAYVNGNPLKYVDPSGLVLFAFDGTGNTDDLDWLRKNGSSRSNVVNFRDLYEDNVRYISGVGTVDVSDPNRPIDPKDYKRWYTVAVNAQTADMAVNFSGPARIARMEEYFDKEADKYADDQVMDIDIIGFSRGAAQARDFANRIAAKTRNGWYGYRDNQGNSYCQKVNFRFLGLWDTVLSNNNSGTTYKLGIPEQFSYVAQAVALTEFRRLTGRKLPNSTGAFPLESIMGIPAPAGATRIELGFIGAHADIGGGFGETESQLAQVALAWMVDQARNAGVSMESSQATIIANPVLHDKSNNQFSTTGSPSPIYEDREVTYLNGKVTTQMEMTGTRMTFADTGQFISYLPPDGPFVDGGVTRIPRKDFVTGTVDMKRYLEWLNANGYNINLTVAQ